MLVWTYVLNGVVHETTRVRRLPLNVPARGTFSPDSPLIRARRRRVAIQVRRINRRANRRKPTN